MVTKRGYGEGFAYLGVLFLVVVIGIGFAAAGEMWQTAQKREKERELLFIGNQFRKAVEGYYLSTPGVVKQYPRELADLLKDRRYPDTRRYLRKLYTDPLTGKTEWGLFKAPDGGIAGVYSLSDDPPFKIANFSVFDRDFEGKVKYSEWKFVYLPTAPIIPGAAAQPAAGQMGQKSAEPSVTSRATSPGAGR